MKPKRRADGGFDMLALEGARHDVLTKPEALADLLMRAQPAGRVETTTAVITRMGAKAL